MKHKKYIFLAFLLLHVSSYSMFSFLQEKTASFKQNYPYFTHPLVPLNILAALQNGAMATCILAKERHPLCIIPATLAFLNFKTAQLLAQKNSSSHQKDVFCASNIVAGIALWANSTIISARSIAWSSFILGSLHLYNAYDLYTIASTTPLTQENN